MSDLRYQRSTLARATFFSLGAVCFWTATDAGGAAVEFVLTSPENGELSPPLPLRLFFVGLRAIAYSFALVVAIRLATRPEPPRLPSTSGGLIAVGLVAMTMAHLGIELSVTSLNSLPHRPASTAELEALLHDNFIVDLVTRGVKTLAVAIGAAYAYWRWWAAGKATP